MIVFKYDMMLNLDAEIASQSYVKM